MKGKINFDKNWNNKLNCDFFTTIRDISKLEKYEQMEHRIVDIFLDGEKFCKAKILSVTTYPFEKLSPQLKLLDTGDINYESVFDKYIKSEDLIVIMCERIK